MKKDVDGHWVRLGTYSHPKREREKYDVDDLQNHFNHVIHIFSYYVLCVTFKNIYSP